jgi:hypothetical protein
LAYAGDLTFRELLLVDRLVSTCHQSRGNFEDFVLATLLYFVAVTKAERADPPGRRDPALGLSSKLLRRASARGPKVDGSPLPSFLQADDPEFVDWLTLWSIKLKARAERRLEPTEEGDCAMEKQRRQAAQLAILRAELRRESQRYNALDLFDPQNRNLYASTAAAKSPIG